MRAGVKADVGPHDGAGADGDGAGVDPGAVCVDEDVFAESFGTKC